MKSDIADTVWQMTKIIIIDTWLHSDYVKNRCISTRWCWSKVKHMRIWFIFVLFHHVVQWLKERMFNGQTLSSFIGYMKSRKVYFLSYSYWTRSSHSQAIDLRTLLSHIITPGSPVPVRAVAITPGNGFNVSFVVCCTWRHLCPAAVGKVVLGVYTGLWLTLVHLIPYPSATPHPPPRTGETLVATENLSGTVWSQWRTTKEKL